GQFEHRQSPGSSAAEAVTWAFVAARGYVADLLAQEVYFRREAHLIMPGQADLGSCVLAPRVGWVIRWCFALLASRNLILRSWERAFRQRFWAVSTVVVPRTLRHHRHHRGSPVHCCGGRRACRTGPNHQWSSIRGCPKVLARSRLRRRVGFWQGTPVSL